MDFAASVSHSSEFSGKREEFLLRLLFSFCFFVSDMGMGGLGFKSGFKIWAWRQMELQRGMLVDNTVAHNASSETGLAIPNVLRGLAKTTQ
ncbi:hypothetical protein C1H46_041051 [Malus baccata]|uniref:Uncharacterized protein n=1 Tax=Malus baccata TaxID=106549 RepID=A0A540KGR0_MALBA|nr:hypothetical protein C1H46_041051 [Malus baccata]